MANYLELFISETEQYIKQLDKELLNLESNKKNLPSILEVFRVFHTIKGMAQTMGFDDLALVSHRIEDLLGDAKSKGEINSIILDFLFVVVDFLNESLQAIKDKKETPPSTEIIDIIEKLKKGEEVKIERGKKVAKEITEIRIKMEKLDKLFNLTNELMIARSRLLILSRQTGDSGLIATTETVSRHISSLQDEVMRLRMLPLLTVFEFFPRWLRDEAKRQQKGVEFAIVGGEIEVDRSIIDVLKEPLLHLLRNALDHGIQEKGTISLTAIRERERIRISVSDNGRGINLEEVRQQAIERNIITTVEAQYLNKEDLYRILVNPNFSTKKTVSTISGRGIGLDIVNSTITKLGGKLEIISEFGKGSCFTVELPLSLAIVRGMIFILNGQRFALPLSYIQETFYAEELSFKTVYHRELYPLRDEILPLVRVGEKLGYPSKPGRKSVIVSKYQGIRRGFVTDGIIGEEEIVVKKLDPLLPHTLFSGCSIHSDGLPILILDPGGLG